MNKATVIQGRKIAPKDIELIKKLISENPSRGRTRLSQELARMWNWRADSGRLKDMACRSLLLKLERKNLITLPAPKGSGNNDKRNSYVAPILHSSQPILAKLKELSPIKVILAQDKNALSLFKCFLSSYHYLGFSGTVGENLKYIIYDVNDRPLGCLLFGAPAWRCAPRDEFIGWEGKGRAKNLALVANNMRFLILPWVKVSHLASYILGKVSRRISSDWEEKYGHPLYLLETFVECDRFAGNCYKASNWRLVGKTKGRSRNDRYKTLKVPIKEIYLYPLAKTFRRELTR